MWKKILRWILGILTVEISGEGKERFLSICTKRNICFWNISFDQEKILLNILLFDFWRIKEVALKTKVFPVVRKRRGFPFWMTSMLWRKGAVLGVVTGALFVWGLSLFLWNIEVEGQCMYSKESIVNCLEKHRVTTGVRVKSITCNKIEEILRKEFDHISWVSAQISGSKLNIRIVEGENLFQKKKKMKKLHLIAHRDAKVKSIVARTGLPCVKEGQQVKKGELLISGIIPMVDDSGEITKKKPVTADGDVWLCYEETKVESCAYEYFYRKFTGWRKKTVSLKFGGKEIFFGNPLKRFNKSKKYDIISNVCNFSIGNSYVFPIRMCTKEGREYTLLRKKHSETEAIQIAKKKMNVKLKQIEKRGNFRIIEKQIQKKEKEVVITTKVEICEKAYQYKKIGKNEWRTSKINEFDGNHD